MRVLLIAMVALVSACAEASVHGMSASIPLPQSTAHSDWPFPQAPRGSAIAPPGAAAGRTQAAPPEGAGPGGIDFAHWRSAEPAAYSSALQAQLQQRYAGHDAAAIQSDLAANGFACEDGAPNLQCQIEISERQCNYNWYVVMQQGRAQPVASFERACAAAAH